MHIVHPIHQRRARPRRHQAIQHAARIEGDTHQRIRTSTTMFLLIMGRFENWRVVSHVHSSIGNSEQPWVQRATLEH